jgi:hypothetical protein
MGRKETERGKGEEKRRKRRRHRFGDTGNTAMFTNLE